MSNRETESVRCPICFQEHDCTPVGAKRLAREIDDRLAREKSATTKDFIAVRDALDRAERSFSFFIHLATTGTREDCKAIIDMAWEERTIARKAMDKARKVKV